MVRIPVPSDYDDGPVPLPSDMAYESAEAVIGDPGGRCVVREDDDGRYVGVPAHYADFVREYLGIDTDAADDAVSNPGGGTGDASETDDAPTCAGETAGGEACTREVDEPGDYCFQHSEDN